MSTLKLFLFFIISFFILNIGMAESQGLGDRLNYIEKRLKQFSFEGLLEVDALQSKNFSNSTTSKVELSEIEFALTFNPDDLYRGFIQIEKESNPSNRFEVAEAWAEVGRDSDFWKIKAGKLVIPFGRYHTNLLTDPITEDMAETTKDALQGSLSWKELTFSAYVFQCSKQELGKSARLRQGGAALDYGFEAGIHRLDVSIDYLTSFAETDLISSKITNTNLREETSAIATSLKLAVGQWSLFLEYLSALDELNNADLAWGAGGAKPSSSLVEVSYDSTMWGGTVFSLGHQQTSEALGLELPKSKFFLASTINLQEQVSLGFEHAIGKDYKTTDCVGTTCGTDRSNYTTTARLALSF